MRVVNIQSDRSHGQPSRQASERATDRVRERERERDRGREGDGASNQSNGPTIPESNSNRIESQFRLRMRNFLAIASGFAFPFLYTLKREGYMKFADV